MGNTSRKYTAEFKGKAVELYRQAGPDTTFVDIAKDLGRDPSTLRAWVKKADGFDGAGSTKRNPFEVEEELKRLKRENARLKRDNEIFLKASAFFASRNL